MKTLNRLIAFSILLILISLQTVSAKEIVYKPNDISIMFVLDCSNSMNRNDPKGVAVEMMEMFIDILPSHRASVGYVAYNHGITSFTEPISLETEGQRKSLKNKISRIRKSGFSDMGLGLKTGFELVTGNLKENTQPVIILISDGETNLSSHSIRNVDDANHDIDYVVGKAKELNMPIYTIEIGDEFETINTLLTISNETGGKFYRNLATSDFIDVVSQVIKSNDNTNINPLLAAIGTGKKQEMVIPIEDSMTKEVNIILTTQYPIKEPKIFYKGEKLSFSQSKNYFAAKISNPIEQEIRLEFISRTNDTMKAYLVSSYDMSLILDIPDNIQKNKDFNIDAYLRNNIDNEVVENLKFYNKIIPSFRMISDTQEVDLNVNTSKEKIQASTRLEHSGNYTLYTFLTHPNFDIAFNEVLIGVKNNQPQGEFLNKIKLHTASKPKTYQLDKYFQDTDGDKLTYEIINTDTDGLEIKDSILTINSISKGEYQFIIKATDNEGLSYKSEPISLLILPTLQYYYPITITVVCLLIAVLISIIIYIKRKAPKPTFTGKLNAYFISLKDGDEVAPLTFPLYQFENKKRISLEELLLHANINKPFLNAKQIYFEPGLDKAIVFYNTTSATCMKDATILRKDVRYSLEYKAKIYITFEDGSEMELHYNRCNPSQQDSKNF
ncbi:von Willebrand factor type A domain-containing protein [Anaerovirgula multivorans]|uniref:von Willebrand factor type A domain-containing protein n=1 Tax=Anaerovirgula multivorans TaxID=312168 RepID=A0A239C413_9FIRM|nr:vWA domain-containing protein [Anaerovirgula multivorans]SNS15015.1 von Willebrand factor type A domain-containing protein [Anaerovirgula multivorans]